MQGISLDQGVWVPTIRELFRLARQPNSTLKINSAWLFERPNHGDPALMNAEELKNYTEICEHPPMFLGICKDV
jgi:hypothetical protein